jgi:hypothetical protein
VRDVLRKNKATGVDVATHALNPRSDPKGNLLLVALKIPPSRTGTYANLTPVRPSNAPETDLCEVGVGTAEIEQKLGPGRQ